MKIEISGKAGEGKTTLGWLILQFLRDKGMNCTFNDHGEMSAEEMQKVANKRMWIAQRDVDIVVTQDPREEVLKSILNDPVQVNLARGVGKVDKEYPPKGALEIMYDLNKESEKVANRLQSIFDDPSPLPCKCCK